MRSVGQVAGRSAAGVDADQVVAPPWQRVTGEHLAVPALGEPRGRGAPALDDELVRGRSPSSRRARRPGARRHAGDRRPATVGASPPGLTEAGDPEARGGQAAAAMVRRVPEEDRPLQAAGAERSTRARATKLRGPIDDARRASSATRSSGARGSAHEPAHAAAQIRRCMLAEVRSRDRPRERCEGVPCSPGASGQESDAREHERRREITNEHGERRSHPHPTPSVGKNRHKPADHRHPYGGFPPHNPPLSRSRPTASTSTLASLTLRGETTTKCAGPTPSDSCFARAKQERSRGRLRRLFGATNVASTSLGLVPVDRKRAVARGVRSRRAARVVTSQTGVAVTRGQAWITTAGGRVLEPTARGVAGTRAGSARGRCRARRAL